MGLDFAQSGAHWSYGRFMRFRTRLAAAIGIDLGRMEGFKEYLDPINADPPIPWSTVTDDLVSLLDHSDCDGVLTAEEMRRTI
jgi:hypothetical protein